LRVQVFVRRLRPEAQSGALYPKLIGPGQYLRNRSPGVSEARLSARRDAPRALPLFAATRVPVRVRDDIFTARKFGYHRWVWRGAGKTRREQPRPIRRWASAERLAGCLLLASLTACGSSDGNKSSDGAASSTTGAGGSSTSTASSGGTTSSGGNETSSGGTDTSSGGTGGASSSSGGGGGTGGQDVEGQHCEGGETVGAIAYFDGTASNCSGDH